jgi:hypothetical protein
MNLSAEDQAFLEKHPMAGMVTIADGRAKVVKMEPVLVEGRLWSAQVTRAYGNR